MTISLWTRPDHRPVESLAKVLWVVWAQTRPELKFNPEEDGFPSAQSALAMEVTWAEDHDWLDGWLEGATGAILEDNPRLDASALRRAGGAWLIDVERPDPPDLSHLQSASAAARAMARSGAIAFLDVFAANWWHPADLLALAPGRPFEVEEHISIIFESDEDEDGAGHICHTRGMRKFARPELLMRGLAAQDGPAAARYLNSIAGSLATGTVYGESSVVGMTGDRGQLPDTRFLLHPDDSDSDDPMFMNAVLEVIDLHEGVSADAPCRRLLAALRE